MRRHHVLTPKGWDNIAQGFALGPRLRHPPSLKGWDTACRTLSGCGSLLPSEPGALPRARLSHPSGVKTAPGNNSRGCSLRRPWVAALALALLALPACSKPAPTSGGREVQPVPVTVGAVKTVELPRTAVVVGTLFALEDVALAPKVDGRVLRWFKKEGDAVYPGEVLLELDPTDYELAAAQARLSLEAELKKLRLDAVPESDAAFSGHIPKVDAVAQARATLELAEKELTRAEFENKQGVGSGQALDSTRTRVKVAKTGVDLAETEARVTLANARRLKSVLNDAETRLRETRLVAPVPDGETVWSAVVGPAANPVRYSVAAKMVAQGAQLSPMRVTTAYRLVLDHVLLLRVPVPEKYKPEVRIGQQVGVRVDAYRGVTFPGRVARVFPTTDPVNRTFVAEVEVPNYDRRLSCGGFATGEVLLRTDAGVRTVPPEAVVSFAGTTKVYVADGDVARAIEVEVGTREKDWVEVRGALKPDAKVITSGQSQLVDGSPIRIR
jgi:multidrug efflux pump subunit AcrA (membrane-fusion protein)